MFHTRYRGRWENQQRELQCLWSQRQNGQWVWNCESFENWIRHDTWGQNKIDMFSHSTRIAQPKTAMQLKRRKVTPEIYWHRNFTFTKYLMNQFRFQMFRTSRIECLSEELFPNSPCNDCSKVQGFPSIFSLLLKFHLGQRF